MLMAEFKDHKDDNGVQLARRAEQNYKWISSLSLGQFDLNATYTYTGKRLDLPTATPKNEDYIPATNLWDMSVGYWVSQDMTLRGELKTYSMSNMKVRLATRLPSVRTISMSLISFKFRHCL